MNWGKGIILVLVIFVLFITGMSVKFFLMPVDDYDHQYYENGLNFDHDYNREKQVVTDHAAPSLRISGQEFHLTFNQPVTGNIKFLRPSDTALDRTFKLEGKEIEISLKTIPAGQWQLVMNWENDHKAYLFHKEVYIK
jgi:hypothetical protein